MNEALSHVFAAPVFARRGGDVTAGEALMTIIPVRVAASIRNEASEVAAATLGNYSARWAWAAWVVSEAPLLGQDCGNSIFDATGPEIALRRYVSGWRSAWLRESGSNFD